MYYLYLVPAKSSLPKNAPLAMISYWHHSVALQPAINPCFDKVPKQYFLAGSSISDFGPLP